MIMMIGLVQMQNVDDYVAMMDLKVMSVIDYEDVQPKMVRLNQFSPVELE